MTISDQTSTTFNVVSVTNWNPSYKNTNITLSNGNLTATSGLANINSALLGVSGKSSGKWYFEVSIVLQDPGIPLRTEVGIGTALTSITDGWALGRDANGYAYNSSGNSYHNNTFTAYGAEVFQGDIVSVLFDADAGTLIFWLNGVTQGTAFSGLSGTFYPGGGLQDNGALSTSITANFGASAFTYTPPAGYSGWTQ